MYKITDLYSEVITCSSGCSSVVELPTRRVGNIEVSGAGLFSYSILSNMSLIRSLKEAQHYCFSSKIINAKLCSITGLIGTDRLYIKLTTLDMTKGTISQQT